MSGGCALFTTRTVYPWDSFLDPDLQDDCAGITTLAHFDGGETKVQTGERSCRGPQSSWTWHIWDWSPFRFRFGYLSLQLNTYAKSESPSTSRGLAWRVAEPFYLGEPATSPGLFQTELNPLVFVPCQGALLNGHLCPVFAKSLFLGCQAGFLMTPVCRALVCPPGPQITTGHLWPLPERSDSQGWAWVQAGTPRAVGQSINQS